jgi:hypothetical protein
MTQDHNELPGAERMGQDVNEGMPGSERMTQDHNELPGAEPVAAGTDQGLIVDFKPFAFGAAAVAVVVVSAFLFLRPDPVAGPGSSASAVPTQSSAGPTAAAPAPSGAASWRDASAAVNLDGTQGEILNGECVVAVLDGERLFSLSVGDPSVQEPRPDYFGLIVTEHGDGTYADAEFVQRPNGAIGGRPFLAVRGSVQLELRDGMSSGSITGQNSEIHGGGALSASFTCPGGPTGPNGGPIPG